MGIGANALNPGAMHSLTSFLLAVEQKDRRETSFCQQQTTVFTGISDPG
jgi:hypothetical protein